MLMQEYSAFTSEDGRARLTACVATHGVEIRVSGEAVCVKRGGYAGVDVVYMQHIQICCLCLRSEDVGVGFSYTHAFNSATQLDR
jgi:hypothetical protein